MIISIKQMMAMWSKCDLSYNERCTVLKTFILSKIMYILNFGRLSKSTIIVLQKLINNFFWKNRRPSIAFSTLAGKTDAGGLSLPCIKSLVRTLRIKCGLHLIYGTKPVLWHYYALVTVAGKVYRFIPRLWSNLIPHIENNNLFFFEVAVETRRWLSKCVPAQTKLASNSIYWELIEGDIFKVPKCITRIKHLVDVKFFKMLHESKLPRKIFDVWFNLSHFGLNTRSRTGGNEEGRKCLFCGQPETTYHLFISCHFFDRVLNEMFQRVVQLTGKHLRRSFDDIVYLKEITNISYDPVTRTKVVQIIGAHIWSVWSTRNMTIGHYRTPDPIVPSRLFISYMKNI